MPTAPLREQQSAFLRYLLDGDETLRDHVLDDGRLPMDTRMGIYGNAYRLRLKSAITTDHGVLAQYLDQVWSEQGGFEELSRRYIEQHHSRFNSLRHYSGELPNFLQTEKPYAEHPMLADLAEFELALLAAFDAKDEAVCGMQHLQVLSAEQWPAIRLRFHASVRVMHLRSNAVECWQAIKSETDLPTIEQVERYWLLWRSPEQLSKFRSASQQESVFMGTMSSGDNLAEACEVLADQMPAEHIGGFVAERLGVWLEAGLVSELQTD